ncbi:anthranilate synthase component I [bacterium]|nr:MAG: anthranilate synthase component I [bacterium]
MLTPDLSTYLARSEGRWSPVTREILADLDTPVTAYWKLSQGETYSFLLESVTGGEHVGRYSLLGVAAETLRRKDAERDPLLDLQERLARYAGAVIPEGMTHFPGGAVGMMAYDIVRYFERLPGGPTDDLNVDDLAMMLVEAFVVFDHAKNLQRIVVLEDGTDAGYRRAEAKIEAIVGKLRQPLPPLPEGTFPSGEPQANMPRERFEANVETVKDYIGQGDGVQMVPSQRFSVPCGAHPLTLYRALRSLNPSPYMFLLRFGDFDMIGASPEVMTALHGRTARIRPIAGTRWRGKTAEEDVALATELLADPKEIAEHVMLVDLARNDLGRVSETGTVRVGDLMTIERYSHVMHIVSDVTGTLKDGLDAYDLVRAAFPAGTVSGAPKIRAMAIIDEVEPTRRGSYAGAVGWFGVNGETDTCIALRTILLKNGMAYVQAGGGVVADSVPALEYEETRNKAKAALRAIEIANAGL